MTSSKQSLLVLALLATSVLSSQAGSQIVNYFTNPISTCRSDPVVSPYQVSSHVHMIFGGGAFDQGMTKNQALNAKCSANNILDDKSNYWMPSLFFIAPNGSFFQVQAVDYKVYYAYVSSIETTGTAWANVPTSFEQTSDNMVPFPAGLHFVAGDPLSRTPPGLSGHNIDPNHGVIVPYEIQCVNTKTHFTDEYCTDYNGLRTNIYFPQCYNPAAGLESYTNNWAYSSSANVPSGKSCPSGWLHHPQLNLEVYWNVHAFDRDWTPGVGHIPWVFAHGDPTGAGAHADFIAGWNENTLATAIANCGSAQSFGNGALSDCFPNQKVSMSDGFGCTVACPVDERIWGELLALPGCNPIQPGPGRAVVNTGCGATTMIGTRQTQFTDFTQSLGWEYYGCYTDALNSGRALIGVGDITTNEDCINLCSQRGYSYAGTEYSKECYCGNSLTAANGNGVASAICSWPCFGDRKQICGGPNLLSVYRKCGKTGCKNNSGPIAAPHVAKKRNAGRFVD